MPIWLWAFALVAFVLLVETWTGFSHIRSLRGIFSAQMLDQILPPGVRRRRLFAAVAVSLGSVLLVIALAGPRFGKEIKTIAADGVDLVLVVDVSRSMDATDVDPSRLERAKREIFDLLEVVEGDRIGLVVYAGGAFPRVPLTMDYRALRTVVNELNSESVGAQGSAMGAAVRMGLKLLDTDTSSAGKALLILSDGEVHETSPALAAATEASVANVVIYSMGIGQEGAPIPLKTGGFLQHEGQMVLTSPRADLLTELARRTGGAFVESSAANADIIGLYRDEMRAKLRTVERRSRQREQWRDGFYTPMLLGGLLFFFAAWLGDGRQRVLLAVLALCVSPGALAADQVSGDAHYGAGRFFQAAREYGELVLTEPGSATLWERLGAARYHAGDYEGAADAFAEWGRLSGPDRDSAEFNKGNALYEAGRLEDALNSYQAVLRQDPEHAAAKNNEALVAADLVARRAQKPPPPPEQQNQDQQSSSESEPKDQNPPENPTGSSDFNLSPSEGKPNSEASSSADVEEKDGPSAQQNQQSDSTEEGDREASEGGFMEEEGTGQPEGEGRAQGAGEPLAEGEISAAEAERILDGVEEGSPRTRRPQSSEGERPW
jgi:Ca-activated chloride channel family protein